jgi:hypothetical protein
VRSVGAALLLAGIALAACSSTTNGAGTAGALHQPSSQRSVTTSVAAPSTSPAGTSAAGSSTGPAIHPAPTAPLRTVTVQAPDGNNYVVQVWQQVDNTTCYDHAHGQPIITFLTQHPCTGLRRYLCTTTVAGQPAAFAEASTGFAGAPGQPYKWASEFKQLEQQDNTGSINDLLSEGYRLPSGPTSVPSAEAFNVLGQDNGVVIYDAWYLDGPTPNQDQALIKMTEDVFLQF